jgi:DNA-binding response OmpR family regulator
LKILIVEDEFALADTLGQLLKRNNYDIDIVYDGEAGVDYARSGIYDLIVMDLMLPKKDGIQAIKELRKTGVKTPVLILTAKDDIRNKVSGLDSGADDYLTKPFSTEELMARIRALSRRKSEVTSNYIKYGDLILEISDLSVNCKGNKINLTLKEYNLTELLINHKNTVVTKELLLEKVWGYSSDANYNNIEVYISFLRKKLLFLQSAVKIKTVRGIGYSIDEV